MSMFQFDPFDGRKPSTSFNSDPQMIPNPESIRDSIASDLVKMITEEVVAMGDDVSNELNQSMGMLLQALGIGHLRIVITPTVTVDFE
jgi:hypothetical protein